MRHSCSSCFCTGLILGVTLSACSTDQRHIVVHYESPADVISTLPPCDPKTFQPGMECRGTAVSGGPTIFTGDWDGTTEYQYGWSAAETGDQHAAIVETFRGTVQGCGRGSFMNFILMTQVPDGTLRATWSTIDGSGTGDLAHVHGSGEITGVFRNDFTSSGDFRGAMTCGR